MVTCRSIHKFAAIHGERRPAFRPAPLLKCCNLGGYDWLLTIASDEAATLATPPEPERAHDTRQAKQARVSDNPGRSGYWRRHQRLRSLPIIPSSGARRRAQAGLGLVLFAPSVLCASVDCRREGRPWARAISRACRLMSKLSACDWGDQSMGPVVRIACRLASAASVSLLSWPDCRPRCWWEAWCVRQGAD